MSGATSPRKSDEPSLQTPKRPPYLYPLPLQPLYEHFGAQLQALRLRTGTKQSQMERYLEPYFQKAGQALLGSQMYAKTERDLRYPLFEELLPVATCLVEELHCRFSALDARDYLQLARKKIESNPRKKSLIEPEQWEKLQAHLKILVNVELNEQVEEGVNTQQEQQERQQLLRFLEQDTSHILGRENDCSDLLSFFQPSLSPRKKVIAVSAMSGVGKSSLLKLLQKRLLASQGAQALDVIVCTFQEGNKEVIQTAQERFDELLAYIYTALVPKQKELSTVPPVKKRIQQTLQAISAHSKPLVIFLDDAQRLMETQGEWCDEWKQFLQGFTSTSHHHATLYVASREWPIWRERESASFLVQKELPTLTTEIGIQVWHNLGFAQEDEKLLRRATELCGNNPRMMELVAQKLNTPDFSFDWDNDGLSSQRGLAHFVEHPHLTGIAPLLEDIIGNTLSEPAKHLLKLLALATVALPPPVVLHVSPSAKPYIHELARASLLSKHPDRLRLLPMVSESATEHLLQTEREALHTLLMQAYQYWLQSGKFQSEQEQAQVVAELLLLLFRYHQLMEAAELLISGGWLCYHFGHGPRLARVCQEVLTNFDWKQSPQQELAANLLYDRLATFRGEKVTTAERAKRYQTLYDRSQEAGIVLPASIVIHLLQFIVFQLADTACFQEAQSLVTAHLTQVTPLREREPFIFASYLYCQAYLSGRWGEYKLQQNQPELPQAKELFENAVLLFKDCIDLLKECERGASPLQRSRAKFKRARRLHNYAYYAKMIEADPSRIEQALEESIALKKNGYASGGSLAVAYAEYAQYLMSIGRYQDAFDQSDQALQEGEQLVQSGYPEAESELAVLQVERGEIHLLVGDLDEAKRLFSLALPHVANAERRKTYSERAKSGLQTIVHLETTLNRKKGESLRGQLDHRWFARYKQIADYDLFEWLAQAGPFVPEEQEPWNKLMESGRIEDLKQLMQKTLQRELRTALGEQRAPHICYPAIPIVTVKQKREDCFTLKRQIEKEETNRIVKQLYLDVLDEQMVVLSMIEAISQGDKEAFTSFNRRLFAIPTPNEMDIAVNELLKVVDRGLREVKTETPSRNILRFLQKHALVPPHYQIREEKQEEKLSPSLLLQQIQQEEAMIPIGIAAQFLESQMQAYGFTGWKVKVDRNAISEFVEANTEELVLPAKDLTPKSLHSVFAHEVECHVLRHANGARSKLALLGHGLVGYSPIEEALAVRYTASAQGKEATVSWLGTLAIGLASGVSNVAGKTLQPLTYSEVFCLLQDYRLLKQLQQGKEEKIAQTEAHRFAQNTCLRIWRGVPAPFSPGICSVKDNTYLHGKLQLDQYLEQHREETVLEQLSVGCISTEHLASCYQLGIIKPVITNKQLARQETFLQSILDLLKKIEK
jgi:hypothetical protein